MKTKYFHAPYVVVLTLSPEAGAGQVMSRPCVSYVYVRLLPSTAATADR